MRARLARLARLALAAASGVGCGGAAPLLHPAHVEPEGVVTAGAGVSGQFVTGDAANKLRKARETTVQGLAPTADADVKYRVGALAVAALGPGVSPFVSARVGIGGDNEAGLSYTGRSLRIDARHAFQTPSWALSIGLGGHGTRGRPGDGTSSELAGLSTEGVNGFGVDLPILVGWRSDAQLLSFWGGGRAGFEKLGGRICLGEGGQGCPASTPWSATRSFGGAVLGFTLGFRHVFVSLEVDGYYQHAKASFDDRPGDVAVSGFTIAPSGAVMGRF